MFRQFVAAHSKHDEDEIPEEIDASRPLFTRNKGEMGIYVDAIDSVPVNPKEFSLAHFYMMNLRDKLQEYLNKIDMVKVKGMLEERKVFSGVILEEFRKGLVLVVTFDDIEAVNSLWDLHRANKLSGLFQDILIDGALLKAVTAKRVVIRARLWEDEYNDVKVEMLERGMERLPIVSFPNDIAMIKRIQKYQKKLGEKILRLRDVENEFEQNLSDFMAVVKLILPDNNTKISTLKEFTTCCKIAKGTNRKLPGFENIDLYMKTIEELRKLFEKMEERICYPLSLVHRVCESKSQTEMKMSIMDIMRNMKNTLKPDNDLQSIKFTEWESKILQREMKLFYGLISIIPLSIERITDIDQTMDEYVTCFPDKI